MIVISIPESPMVMPRAVHRLYKESALSNATKLNDAELVTIHAAYTYELCKRKLAQIDVDVADLRIY